MNSNTTMIKKLRTAINNKAQDKLLYNTTEIWSEQEKRNITIYTIKRTTKNTDTGRNKHTELFHSTSQIQIVLFLRDYWYKLNNIPLPTDNEKWNGIRETIKEI